MPARGSRRGGSPNLSQSFGGVKILPKKVLGQPRRVLAFLAGVVLAARDTMPVSDANPFFQEFEVCVCVFVIVLVLLRVVFSKTGVFILLFENTHTLQ